MARVTKIKESAVVDFDIVSETELGVTFNTHLSDYHSLTSTPLIALPYYYDAVRLKYLSHERTALIYDTSSSAISNNYLNLFSYYSSGVQGFDVHGDVYCLVDIEYRVNTSVSGNVFYIRDNNNTGNILHTLDVGVTPLLRHYDNSINLDLPSTSEIGGYIGAAVQDKPVVTLGLRKVYIV